MQNFCAPDVGNTPKKVVAANALVHAVCAGEPEGGAAPKVGVDVGLGHVATLATLPAAQAEGHPHAAHVAIEVAPTAELNVPAAQRVHTALPATLNEPAAHAVGATAFAGQKEPAGQGVVEMVYEMPLAATLTSV